MSNESEFDPSSESIVERISALRQIVPASTRYWVSKRAQTAWEAGRTVAVYGGRLVWMASATAMLFGVPYGLCYLEEQQLKAMEQEQMQKMAGDEMLTGGGEGEKVEARPGL